MIKRILTLQLTIEVPAIVGEAEVLRAVGYAMEECAAFNPDFEIGAVEVTKVKRILRETSKGAAI